jgi:benzylsuccinate CoA-transferase BbsF subunit
VFPCAGEDRWIALAITSDDAWRALVDAMERPAWATAPELDALAGRLAALAAIHERLATWTARCDDYELAARLQKAGVAATPVLNVADLLRDPHYRARGTFIEVTHPLGFKETIYGAYVKTSRSDIEVRTGPRIGQDNERVFKGLLGMDDARYRALVEAQTIY